MLSGRGSLCLGLVMHESSCQMYQIQNLKSLSRGLDCLALEVQSGLGAPSLEQLTIFPFGSFPGPLPRIWD